MEIKFRDDLQDDLRFFLQEDVKSEYPGVYILCERQTEQKLEIEIFTSTSFLPVS